MIHKNNKQVKLIVGKYKAGKETGEWTDYDENGAVNAKGNYDTGKWYHKNVEKRKGCIEEEKVDLERDW